VNWVGLPFVVGGRRTVAGMHARDREAILLFARTWRVAVVMRIGQMRPILPCWQTFTWAAHWLRLENPRPEMRLSFCYSFEEEIGWVKVCLQEVSRAKVPEVIIAFPGTTKLYRKKKDILTIFLSNSSRVLS